MSGSVENTLFASSLHQEQDLQKVDNINVFYVALTRAKKCLHVIAQDPPKAFKESKTGAPDYKDFSQLLYTFCGGLDEFRVGSMYDFSATASAPAPSSALLRNPVRENAPEGAGVDARQADFPYSYQSIPIGDRLKVSADASDFFGEDGAVGPAASPRRNGIILHAILSKVQVAGDLRNAVDEAVFAGIIEIVGESLVYPRRALCAFHNDETHGMSLYRGFLKVFPVDAPLIVADVYSMYLVTFGIICIAIDGAPSETVRTDKEIVECRYVGDDNNKTAKPPCP